MNLAVTEVLLGRSNDATTELCLQLTATSHCILGSQLDPACD